MPDAPLLDRLHATGQSALAAALLAAPPWRIIPFEMQIRQVNWEQVQSWYRAATLQPDPLRESPLLSRLQPPRTMISLPRIEGEYAAWHSARSIGEEALAAGQVAVITVAGGQGTRLGFNSPKGAFPIGPVTERTLFQEFCEQIRALHQRYGSQIPYGMMTSTATHEDTVALFEEQSQYGLAPEQVTFFCQGNLPAVDLQTGAALLAGPAELALSPDGHGGLLATLHASGWLDDCRDRGVRWIFYHQVDNPLTRLADPVFVGWHIQTQADVSTKVVAKQSAGEKVGVLAELDGKACIAEYSDLPPELTAAVDDEGRLKFRAGNTAVHCFTLEFLADRLRQPDPLPIHAARKVVPHVGASSAELGSTPNAIKFERFIFDLLPQAERTTVIEGDRQVDFAPVKNAFGADSPETSRAAITARNRRWLTEAGITVEGAGPIEISPLVSLDGTGLETLASQSPVLTTPILLDGSAPA